MSSEPKSTIDLYQNRINTILSETINLSVSEDSNLAHAMSYSVVNGGKRIRPLLVYACGKCLNVKEEKLDTPALSIELLHSFSLVHDDLPSMDDDNLRRGMPTTHKKYGEATAILAADALQTFAFGNIADSEFLDSHEKINLISLIAKACGASGMTGGQAIDLVSEGKSLNKNELYKLHKMKTGALIHASVMTPFYLSKQNSKKIYKAISDFGWAIGVAFQIRDDLLDIEESSEITGKDEKSDIKNNKATWPATFGKKASYEYCNELLEKCIQSLDIFNNEAEPLRWLTRYLVNRKY
ncbi:MAG TPA: farnesyl diphosphate synthase [Woeseiaceae bacterium]|nr:farnesyl diphosphate synthase [Woeseiaceae bacterium]